MENKKTNLKMTNIFTVINFLLVFLVFISLMILKHRFVSHKEDQNMVELHLNMQIADLKEEIQKLKGTKNGN